MTSMLLLLRAIKNVAAARFVVFPMEDIIVIGAVIVILPNFPAIVAITAVSVAITMMRFTDAPRTLSNDYERNSKDLIQRLRRRRPKKLIQRPEKGDPKVYSTVMKKTGLYPTTVEGTTKELMQMLSTPTPKT